MLVVMFISILFFMFISAPNMWVRMVLRILLIPIIAGIAYEFILFAGKCESPVVEILSKPGLWLQSLTTREPDEKMLEVAISSVEAIFDWKQFLESADRVPETEAAVTIEKRPASGASAARGKEEKEDGSVSGFEVVEVGEEDEDDEILQALDRYFEEPLPDERK